jgi:7-cyano-7-deazaguanine synthase
MVADLPGLLEHPTIPDPSELTGKAVAIVSGGIDSTVALYWAVRMAKKSVTAIAFDYGQRHRRELNFAQGHCDYLGIALHFINIPWMRSLATTALINREMSIPAIKEVLGHPQPVTYVPFRNLLFLTIAAQFAEDTKADTVVFGAQLHDLYGYWDATAEFVQRVNSVFELDRTARIQIVAPLARNSKGANIKLGTELGVNLRLTYSCYEGKEAHCGACATCAERKKGFIDAGIKDPTLYVR